MKDGKAVARAVLVLNSGSSSLKYALYSMMNAAACVARGNVAAIGSTKCTISHRNIQLAQDVKLQEGDQKRADATPARRDPFRRLFVQG